MARVAISVTVFLFLFTLSVSRARDLHNPFSESESKSESAEKIHEPETTTRPQSSKTQQHDTVSFTLDSVDPVPLTLIGFRPINRHIHPRRSLPLPLSLRRCHHGLRREIPYGNDMIVHSDAATGDRRIPARWAGVQGAELRFPGPEMMAHHHHHHHHADSKHDHHEKGWFAKRIREFLNLF